MARLLTTVALIGLDCRIYLNWRYGGGEATFQRPIGSGKGRVTPSRKSIRIPRLRLRESGPVTASRRSMVEP